MTWLPMADAMRRDAMRHDQAALRRAAETARLVGSLRRPRRRQAA